MRLISVCAAALVLLAASAAAVDVPSDRSQSTTGPVPPPGVEPKVERVFRDGERATTISGVPGYLWRHGCGPTALAMVLGYHDTHGLPDLFPGSAATQTPEVNQAIASQRSAGDPGHYEDYSEPIDDFGTGILADRSEDPPGDEHPSDSIADMMLTSWSSLSNYYGWSYGSHMGPAFLAYVAYVSSDYAPNYSEYQMSTGYLTWEVLTGEIDADRPMVFLVDSDGNGGTDHFVTVVGYTDTPTQQYGCLDTWSPASTVRWCDFAQMAGGQPWGIYKGWAFEPDATVYVDASGGGEYLTIQEGIDAAPEYGTVVVMPGIYAGSGNCDLDANGKVLTVESSGGSAVTIIDCEERARGFNFETQETSENVVDGFTIRNGSADHGGGIRCFWNSNPTLTDIVIEDCTATGDGGGVWLVGSNPSLANVTITRCGATNGGGVFCNNCAPALTEVTIHDNSAGTGSGIYCGGTSEPAVLNTIISFGTTGGPIHCDGSADPQFYHSCIYGNAGSDSLCGTYQRNMFRDPLYCDASSSELTLNPLSPCLPANNTWSEQVGAWGEGDCGTGIDDAVGAMIALGRPSPNPFGEQTTLVYGIRKQANITVGVYDIAGRLVRTLADNAPTDAGEHRIHWDGLDTAGNAVSAGVYFFRVEGGGTVVTGRAVLLK